MWQQRVAAMFPSCDGLVAARGPMCVYTAQASAPLPPCWVGFDSFGHHRIGLRLQSLGAKVGLKSQECWSQEDIHGDVWDRIISDFRPEIEWEETSERYYLMPDMGPEFLSESLSWCSHHLRSVKARYQGTNVILIDPPSEMEWRGKWHKLRHPEIRPDQLTDPEPDWWHWTLGLASSESAQNLHQIQISGSDSSPRI